MLMGRARILLNFWEEYLSPQENLPLTYDRIYRALANVIMANEHRVREVEPYILFLKAVAYGLTSDNIIAPDKNSCEKNRRLGYFQTGNLILKSEAIYNYVCQYYYRQGKLFPESLPAILNKLYEMNLLEGYPQKDHKPKLLKQATINGVTQSVICLKWYVAEMILAQHI